MEEYNKDRVKFVGRYLILNVVAIIIATVIFSSPKVEYYALIVFAMGFTANMINKAIFSICYSFKYYVIDYCYLRSSKEKNKDKYEAEKIRIDKKFKKFQEDLID